MEQNPPALLDVVVSLLIGGFLGWLTGGLYNLVNGKKFSGKDKR